MKYDLYINKQTFIGQVEATGEKDAKAAGRVLAKARGMKGRIIAIQVLAIDRALVARITREIRA